MGEYMEVERRLVVLRKESEKGLSVRGGKKAKGMGGVVVIGRVTGFVVLYGLNLMFPVI